MSKSNRWSKDVGVLLALPCACGLVVAFGHYRGWWKPQVPPASKQQEAENNAPQGEKVEGSLLHPAEEVKNPKPESFETQEQGTEALSDESVEEDPFAPIEGDKNASTAPSSSSSAPVPFPSSLASSNSNPANLNINFEVHLPNQPLTPSSEDGASTTSLTSSSSVDAAEVLSDKTSSAEPLKGDLLLQKALKETQLLKPALQKDEQKGQAPDAKIHLKLSSITWSGTLLGCERYGSPIKNGSGFSLGAALEASAFSEELGGSLKLAFKPNERLTNRIAFEWKAPEEAGFALDCMDFSSGSKAAAALGSVNGLRYAAPIGSLHFPTNLYGGGLALGGHFSLRGWNETEDKLAKRLEFSVQAPSTYNVRKAYGNYFDLDAKTKKEKTSWDKFEGGVAFYAREAKLPLSGLLAWNRLGDGWLRKAQFSGGVDLSEQSVELKKLETSSPSPLSKRFYFLAAAFNCESASKKVSWGSAFSLNNGSDLAFGRSLTIELENNGKKNKKDGTKACLGITDFQFSADSALRWECKQILDGRAWMLQGIALGLGFNGFKGFNLLDTKTLDEDKAPAWGFGKLATTSFILNDLRGYLGSSLRYLNLFILEAGFDIHFLPWLSSLFDLSQNEWFLPLEVAIQGSQKQQEQGEQGETALPPELARESNRLERIVSFQLTLKLA